MFEDLIPIIIPANTECIVVTSLQLLFFPVPLDQASLF